jgi:hypothetical protein
MRGALGLGCTIWAEAKQEGAKPYSKVQTSVVWPTKASAKFPSPLRT